MMGGLVVLLKIMLNLIFVVHCLFYFLYLCAVWPLICFGLYMCGILKWWRHPLALSETPKHRVPEQRGSASCFQSLCLPGGTLYQRQQRHRRDERVAVYDTPTNTTSSIILQFAATLKTFRCKYSGTSQTQARTHTPKNTHRRRLAIAKRWLARGKYNIKLMSTLRWQTVSYVSLFLFVFNFLF